MGLNVSSPYTRTKTRVLFSNNKTGASSESIMSMDMSQDHRLMACSQGTLIHIWDCERLSVLTRVRHQKDTVICVRFSFDSSRIAACSLDGTVCIFGRPSGKWIYENIIQIDRNGWEWSCCWLMGSALVTVGTTGNLTVWDTIIPHTAPQVLDSVSVHTRSANCVSSVVISPNLYLISAGNDSCITISELARNAKGLPHLAFVRHIYKTVPDVIYGMDSFEFNNNGESIFAAISSDKSVRIWNMRNVLNGLDEPIVFWNRSRINTLAFSSDGRFLAIADIRGYITVYKSPIKCLNVRASRVWRYRLRMGSIRTIVWLRSVKYQLIAGLDSGKLVHVQIPSILLT